MALISVYLPAYLSRIAPSTARTASLETSVGGVSTPLVNGKFVFKESIVSGMVDSAHDRGAMNGVSGIGSPLFVYRVPYIPAGLRTRAPFFTVVWLGEEEAEEEEEEEDEDEDDDDTNSLAQLSAIFFPLTYPRAAQDGVTALIRTTCFTPALFAALIMAQLLSAKIMSINN
jgi:hypothetical protein